MIDINQIVNQEITREKLQARNELAGEILKIIGCPKSPSKYMDKVYEAQQRLYKVRDEYLEFQSGIPF